MPSFPLIARCTVAAVLAAGSGCASQRAVTPGEAPPLAEFCLEAQQVIVRTAVRPTLIVHSDFDAFVKSKALIDPLNAAFGKGTSGGDGQCQDMNRLTWERVRARLGATAAGSLAFDGAEVVRNAENPGMTGPDWLKPYEMTWRDERGVLHLRSKGFRVDWTDPQFAAVPGRFRGVQYCHLIAPEYLTRLVTGQAEAGLVVGRGITDLSRAPPADTLGHPDAR
jgi:hypothetical protein